jgi:hypothetical protein
MKEGYKANSRLMGLRGKRVSGSQPQAVILADTTTLLDQGLA